MIQDLLAAIQAWTFSERMRESGFLFPLVECFHVVALTFVVGSIAMFDLRLIGVSARNHSVMKLSHDVLPWTWGAFTVAVITGLMMFASNAVKYFDNVPFRLKMLLLVMAGLNMAVFHLYTQRSVHNWDIDTPTPMSAKTAGFLSLAFWIGVVAFGRWIGFTISDGFF